MNEDMHDELRISFHEAGHAVIAIRLGLVVECCSISSDPPSCSVLAEPEPHSYEYKLRLAKYYLAGIQAQFSLHRLGTRAWHCGHDEEQLKVLGVEQIQDMLQEETLDLVENDLETIKRVAQELRNKKTLTGQDIESIVFNAAGSTPSTNVPLSR